MHHVLYCTVLFAISMLPQFWVLLLVAKIIFAMLCKPRWNNENAVSTS